MFPRQPRTLLWRLCLALVVIQVAVAIGLSWYAYVAVRTFHHEQSLAELERLSPLLVARYADALDRDAAIDLTSMMRTDSERSGLRLTLIRPDGVVLADSHRPASEMDNHRERPEVQEAMRGRIGTELRYSTTVNMDMMFLAVKMKPDDPQSMVFRAAIPLARINADLASVLGALAAAGVVSLVLTVLLMYLVSRMLSREVLELAERAASYSLARMGQGSPGEPISAPVSELAPLARALDLMAANLHDRVGELQAQQLEREAILQSMNNGVIAIDREQRILSMNRAAERMLKIDAATSRGRLLQEVTRHSELNRFIDKAFHESNGRMAELALRGDAGRIVQTTANTLTDAKGRPAGLLIVLNDVTELRRLESMRSDFAANVSHELRTPITNIKGYIETMLDVGVKDESQAMRFLEIVKRNSDRLAAIIEDILALAWLEQPDTKEVLQREGVPLRPLVMSVASQFESAATAKSIAIRVDVPAEMTITANAQLIEQALANYVSNAIKYSPSDTTVRISAQPHEDGMIRLSVADQGTGIASEHLPRVFERFYRVDKARSRELGGTGLGLAIVKHIALVHGGRVEVQSALGKGSVFSLILPE